MYGCTCGCGGFAGGYGFEYGGYPGRSSFLLIVVLFILLIIVGRSYTN